jgi:predicted nucleotidyltransferase
MKELKNTDRLLFRGIVGSQSYGLATETSDTDYKSVYLQSNDDILSNNYLPQVDINKDDVAYELRRFLELLSVGNPNVLELLYLPERCIIETSPEFEFIRKHRFEFLSKNCYNTFSGYAKTQLLKSQGINKKFNWEEKRIERKTIVDFCKVIDKQDGKTHNLTEWLSTKNWKQEDLGLVKLDGFRDTYRVYHNATILFDGNLIPALNSLPYRGVESNNTNEPRLSEIPKKCIDSWVGVIYWNRESYSTSCKEFQEYSKWLENRNEHRVATNKAHGQQYDSKNIMHTVRLIMTAEEIPLQKKINVDRTGNRDFLLSIKKGETNLKQIIDYFSIRVDQLKKLYEESDLKEEVSLEYIKDLELKIRKNEL